MHCPLIAISTLIFCLVGEFAYAAVFPLPTNDDTNVLSSQPQITQAPALVFAQKAIEGRQVTQNTCDGFSWLGAASDAANVLCPAPFTCLVGAYSVDPYWDCRLPSASASWYTACVPYSAGPTFFSSSIASCASTAPYCVTNTLIVPYLGWTYWNYGCGTVAYQGTLVFTGTVTTKPKPTTISTPTPTGGGGGFSTSDKIALGVGIGVGLPATLAALFALWMQCMRGQ